MPRSMQSTNILIAIVKVVHALFIGDVDVSVLIDRCNNRESNAFVRRVKFSQLA